MVSVFNRVKIKELTGASGQESVVLAAEVEKQGHCLHRGMNFPEFPCLSCARQVVRVVCSCTVITSRCHEPLEQLADSPDQCTTTTSISKRPTAVRSPTGETPSAKRNREGKAIDCNNKFVSIRIRSSLDIPNPGKNHHKSLTLENAARNGSFFFLFG